MNRTIVIGDLHGCFDAAVALLDRLHVSASDRVLFTGDLVDRGPQPRECVELAMQHESVLGNHEEHHLQIRRSRAEKLSPNHLFTGERLDDAHYAYFASLPTSIRLPEFGAAVVHAGVFPGLPLEEQEPRHLLHVQHLMPPGKKSWWPSKAPADARFWTHFYEGPERIIFGHTVVDRPLRTQWAIGIDTGAVYGRGLTALVLPDWELVTLPTNDRAGGRKSGIARYLLHDDVSAFS